MAIKESQGQTQSVRTVQDQAAELNELIKTLNETELKALTAIFKDLEKQKETSALDDLKKAQYIREPVSMEQFLKDPYYLGETCSELYPALHQDLLEIEKGGYEDYWWIGSTRTGKSFISSILFIWELYKLSCMRNPQQALGLTKGSKISGIVISVNEQTALEVAFDNIVSKLAQSRYFQDHFPYTDNKGRLIFPNDILVVAKATTDRSALGHNIAIAWIDEAAFVSQGKASKVDPRIGYIDHAEVIYNSIKTRMKNTFKASKYKGVFIVSSSKTTKDDFLARFINTHRNDPKLFLKDRNAWTILPDLYKNSRKFKVLCGSELMASRILSDNEAHLFTDLPEGVTIIEVPEEFEPDFQANLERSIQDLAGIFTSSVAPFIQRREKILEACDQNKWPSSLFDDNQNVLLEHPFSVQEYDPTYPGVFLWNKMVKDYYEREYVGYTKIKKPILSPNAYRHIHLDPSFRHDGFGMCMSHILGRTLVTRRSDTGETFQEVAPVYAVDLALRITPPIGGEIEMATIRHMVYQLQENGYKIGCISMDKYVRDGLQPFQARGFSTEWVSVDETTAPYDTLKSALYENRIFFYKYDRLIQELQLLERIYEGKRIKIDHPPTFGKDVADALAGSIFTLSQKSYSDILPMLKLKNSADPWLNEKLGKAKEIYNDSIIEQFPYRFDDYDEDSGWSPLI